MENAVPEFARRLYKEWRDFVATPIDGIELTLNEQDMTEVQLLLEDYNEFRSQARLLTEVHAFWHIREQSKNSSGKTNATDTSSNSSDRTQSKAAQHNASSIRKALKRL
ncbi:unnamed protein product [Trichobilharzia regenti]|nr:unnamed protein product [Trichobilharzia regenti]